MKETLCPTGLPNTNEAHRLFNGERRSVRLKAGSAVISGFLLLVQLLGHTLQWLVESWFADPNKQTNR